MERYILFSPLSILIYFIPLSTSFDSFGRRASDRPTFVNSSYCSLDGLARKSPWLDKEQHNVRDGKGKGRTKSFRSVYKHDEIECA